MAFSYKKNPFKRQQNFFQVYGWFNQRYEIITKKEQKKRYNQMKAFTNLEIDLNLRYTNIDVFYCVRANFTLMLFSSQKQC